MTGVQQIFGEAMPDFSLPVLNGDRASLASLSEGKTGSVVVIWSSTCSHCIRYDSYLNSFESAHPELSLLIVSSRNGETFEGVRSVAEQRNLHFPIAHDARGEVAARWFTRQTPRAFLVDANRSLLYRGAIDNFKFPGDPEYAAYLEPAIAQFLSGRSIERRETASFGCAIQSVYYNLPKVL